SCATLKNAMHGNIPVVTMDTAQSKMKLLPSESQWDLTNFRRGDGNDSRTIETAIPRKDRKLAKLNESRNIASRPIRSATSDIHMIVRSFLWLLRRRPP